MHNNSRCGIWLEQSAIRFPHSRWMNPLQRDNYCGFNENGRRRPVPFHWTDCWNNTNEEEEPKPTFGNGSGPVLCLFAQKKLAAQWAEALEAVRVVAAERVRLSLFANGLRFNKCAFQFDNGAGLNCGSARRTWCAFLWCLVCLWVVLATRASQMWFCCWSWWKSGDDIQSSRF